MLLQFQPKPTSLQKCLRQAQKVLQDLSQSYYSANSLHLKKGILLALAAAAIGFGKEAKPFLTGMLFGSQTSFTSFLALIKEGLRNSDQSGQYNKSWKAN